VKLPPFSKQGHFTCSAVHSIAMSLRRTVDCPHTTDLAALHSH